MEDTDVIIRRTGSSDSWGLNVGRRGSNGCFVVTGVAEDSPASRARLNTKQSPLFEIKRGDDIVAIGALGAKLDTLDAKTSKAEMRILFAGAGEAAVLRLRRKSQEKTKKPPIPPRVEGNESGWRRGWANTVGRARRSMSVDVRDLSRKVRDSITELVVGGVDAENAQSISQNLSAAVAISPRLFSTIGGEPLNAQELLDSLQAALIAHGNKIEHKRTTEQDFGHQDLLDDPTNWESRILFLHISPLPMDESTRQILGKGRIVELGWDAAYGSQTPSLKLVCALGLCAAAWLALDDNSARTIIVVCDNQGDRNRLGLASAACMRLASAIFRSSEKTLNTSYVQKQLGPPVDAAAEAYDFWLQRAATVETQKSLALSRLPPSFSRHLRHIDFAVEARRLPNARPLALLGVSVRGLPLSDAPVLVVAAGGWQSIVWSSEQCQQDSSVVDWDGDEAFYSISASSNTENCILFGDFAIVLKFGGAYGASLEPNDPAAAIARYVANTAFLSDGAIDVLFSDVDLHPAYAPALAYGSGKDDFKLRLAFRYADAEASDDFFTLPSSAEAALDRGLRLVGRYHAVTADKKICADLQALGVPKTEVAQLLLQLADNDIDKAFMLTNSLPRLADALLDPADLAELEKKFDLSLNTTEASKEQPNPTALNASVLLTQRSSEDVGEDDELDARDYTIVPNTVEEQPKSRFGKRGNRKRHESLPPPISAPPPSLDIRQAEYIPPEPPINESPLQEEVKAPTPQAPNLEPAAPSGQKDVATPRAETFETFKSQIRPSEPQGLVSQPDAPTAESNDTHAMDSTPVMIPPSDTTTPSLPTTHLVDTNHTTQSAVSESARPSSVSSTSVDTTTPTISKVQSVDAVPNTSETVPEAETIKVEPSSQPQSAAASFEKSKEAPSSVPKEEAKPKKEDKHSALAAMLSQRAPSPNIVKEANGEEDYSGVPLREHPDMKEWVKLLKVGLPKGAVARKMMEEGVDPGLLEFDLKKPPPPEALALLNKKANKEDATALIGRRNWGKRSEAKKRQSLKPVHWEPLSKAEGTVWATAASNDVDDAERAELKRLFAVKKAKVTKKTGRATNAEPEACDAKRAANIAIGLKPLSEKFEGNLEQLVSEGVAMDASRLSPENIDQLVAILPTEQELEDTRRLFLSGDTTRVIPKRRAEQLFIAIAHVIDTKALPGGLATMRKRLTLFSDYLAADEAAKQIHLAADAVQEAANQAIHSKALAETLQRLLTVGNALNEGTHRGGAAGFKLASLQRLATTKSQETGVSVIDFSVRKKFEHDVRSLDDLVPLLKAANKVNLNELRREVRRLETTSASLKEIDQSSQSISLADCAETARRASTALDAAADRAVAAATFFGEDVPDNNDPDLSTIFGPLAEFLDDFLAAYTKYLEQEEERAAAAENIVEKRQQRSRQRSRRGISVDDILKDSSSKKRSSLSSSKKKKDSTAIPGSEEEKDSPSSPSAVLENK